MFDARLPAVANTFLRSMESGDVELLLSVLNEDALIRDGYRQYRGSAIHAWARAYLAGTPVGGRVINRRWENGTLVLTILARGAHGARHSELFHWRVEIRGDRIAELSVERSSMPELPHMIARFITAVNDGDAAAIVATFADEALVNDELVDHWGAAQIRSWAERNVIGKRLALYVVGVVMRDERLVVTCHATGDFDGVGLPDPLVLSLYVSTFKDRIVQLIILQNPAPS